ncbi:MAG TPA: deoxyribonuclease IV [Candidatus Dojkabacteria bacterium]|nr:deoxyribonuclease IV [Candidatus Dojkabacteria bacterium]HQF37086.1 deoxyribonuclease IV [Candidatus Dojkabacteria bacterium]
MKRNYGAHINGPLEKAFEICKKYGFNSIQTMPTAPMQWSIKPIDPIKGYPLSPDDDRNVNKILKNSPLKNILIHGVYLINLSRKEKQKFHLSKLSLVNYLNFAQSLINVKNTKKVDINILGVCFHPGSAIDLSDQDGLKRIAQGLTWIHEQTIKSAPDAKILIESTAGAGNIVGDKLEELQKMKELTSPEVQRRIGYVLDTQHMWVSGYDWENDNSKIFKNIDNTVGIENVKAIHLNNSMTELGSHRDRHANLSEGKISIEAISQIINHPSIISNNIPIILETPALKDEEGIKSETTILGKIAK